MIALRNKNESNEETLDISQTGGAGIPTITSPVAGTSGTARQPDGRDESEDIVNIDSETEDTETSIGYCGNG